MPTDLSRLRNFCIIAHIDHGKSTLADRLLDLTHAVSERNMRAQYLDKMDLERERGITIKAQAVRLAYAAGDGREYVLNLIDTPGHVDFTYEVSRALAACEGAVLLVDAAQGIEAQTLANLYLAVEADLAIIPVINKIDLPAAQPDRVAREIEQVLGTPASEMLRVSAKTGEGVPGLLEAIVRRVPPPTGDPEAPARALVFDSLYDPYRGVIAYVRMVDGRLAKNDRVRMMAAGHVSEAEEVGCSPPKPSPPPSSRPARSATSSRASRTCARSGWGTPSPPPAGWRPSRWVATGSRGQWSSRGCTRSRATTSPTCATPWTGCGSTTPPWSTSPSRRPRSGSGSAAASSGCSTWTSSASGWSASSTWPSSPPPPTSPTGSPWRRGRPSWSPTPASCRRPARSSGSRSRTCRPWCCARPTTSAR